MIHPRFPKLLSPEGPGIKEEVRNTFKEERKTLMPLASISPNFPQPQNLLPPSCADNSFSLLCTFPGFLSSPLILLSTPPLLPIFCYCPLFSQLLEKTVQQSSPSDNSTSHLPAAWHCLWLWFHSRRLPRAHRKRVWRESDELSWKVVRICGGSKDQKTL